MNCKPTIIYGLLLSLSLGCSSSRDQNSTDKHQHVKRQSKKIDSNKIAMVIESIIDYQIDQKQQRRKQDPTKKTIPPRYKH